MSKKADYNTLKELHDDLAIAVRKHGIRASAKLAGINPMRVSRFCENKGYGVSQIAVADFILMANVVAQLRGTAITIDLSELTM